MDALVLINSPDEDDAVFVPGKLYDYLMARRPVVFLGCEGDAWRIVADTSGPSWCFRYAQKDLIARHLAGLIGTRPPDTQRSTDHEPSRSFAPLLSRLE
jgi:hypothetical protein